MTFECPVTEMIEQADPRIEEAIEDNWISGWAPLGIHPGIEFFSGPDLVRFLTDVQHPICNNIFRANLCNDASSARIQESLEPARDRRVPLLWWVGPSSGGGVLSQQLLDAGLSVENEIHCLSLDLQTVEPERRAAGSLRVEHVCDEVTLADWITVFSSSFGFPDPVADVFREALSMLGYGPEVPIRSYVGYSSQNKPVACIKTVLSDGIAGFYNLATVPEVRGQGLGYEIHACAMEEVKALGYLVVAGRSGNGNLPLYRKMGWKQHQLLTAYAFDGAGEGRRGSSVGM